MSAFVESLDDILAAWKVEKKKFKRVSNENFEAGQLIGHKPATFSTGEEFELCDIYFVDNGAFAFRDRDILTRAAPIIDEHLAEFQLEMHVGNVKANGEESASKTECVFFPPPNFFKPLPMIIEAEPSTKFTTLSESVATWERRQGVRSSLWNE
jgi:hypothetical protein